MESERIDKTLAQTAMSSLTEDNINFGGRQLETMLNDPDLRAAEFLRVLYAVMDRTNDDALKVREQDPIYPHWIPSDVIEDNVAFTLDALDNGGTSTGTLTYPDSRQARVTEPATPDFDSFRLIVNTGYAVKFRAMQFTPSDYVAAIDLSTKHRGGAGDLLDSSWWTQAGIDTAAVQWRTYIQTDAQYEVYYERELGPGEQLDFNFSNTLQTAGKTLDFFIAFTYRKVA